MLFHCLSRVLILNFGFAQLITASVNLIYPSIATASDVTFYLATQSQPNPVLITSGNATSVNVTMPTKVIVHGWLQDYIRQWIQDMTAAYLATYNVNIILVDWSVPAGRDYYSAAKSVGVVGNTTAKFILDIGLTPGNVHILGHSLGAQAGGFAGQYLRSVGQLLERITGLDPAGPLFGEGKTDDDRLSKSDAAQVEGVHTDAGVLGYKDLVGSLDIYVNSGHRIQPGCIEDAFNLTSTNNLQKVFCSHARAHTYFNEAINKGKFNCKFCDPPKGETFIYGGNCTDNGKRASLGAEDITQSTTGICFAATNSAEPYLS